MVQKNRYMKMGLTVFVVVSAILLFYDTLFGRRVLPGIWNQFVGALRPVLYGAFMAYLLAPMVDFFEEKLFRVRSRRERGLPCRNPLAVRAVGIILTWAVISALGYLLGSVLLPELYRSVQQLLANAESYYNTVMGWIERLLETYPEVENWALVQFDGLFERAQQWVQNDMLPQAQTLVVAVSGGLMSVVGFFGDLLIGVIVSMYLLATKENCAAYAKKVVYGLCSEKNVRWVLQGARKMDRIFSGFVRGKLLDSLIIGLLCFAGCSVLQFPYTPLVSVIVGVTNVIPFFGPFLGAIPSTFLILLSSPMQALYFVLFVLALQQLDGNVIGPKILGGKTGLSSLWVIVAILVGGSFFGVLGMFFGVPVCACLYSAANFFVEMRLRERELPLDTKAYREDDPVGRQEKP